MTVIECDRLGRPVDSEGNLIPENTSVVGKKFGAQRAIYSDSVSAEAFKTVYDEMIRDVETLIIKERPWNTP